MAVIVIVVAVVVPPRPIFFLFLWRKFAEVSIAIPMRLVGPTVVIDDFVIVPNVIIGVIGIINAVSMMFTGKSRHGDDQRSSEYQKLQRVRNNAHVVLL